jgi:myo-inositol-1(or 4)-monophosphatase
VNAGERLLEAAQRAAQHAAEFLREQEGRVRPEAWTSKGRADYVTEVDRESERMIAEMLKEAIPGCTVIGEELTPNPEPRTPNPVFIVDPLDGTTNFLHRFPMYAVSIAATVNGVLEAGCVLHVTPDITYTATRGGGARQDGASIHVSDIREPIQALIGTGFPYNRMEQLPVYQRQFAAVVAGAGGVRRPGSAALDLCDVAAGRYDGFWELRLAPWDVAAGVLMIREAGGIVTNLTGAPEVLDHSSVVAGNPAIHAWLLKALS